LGLFRFAQKRIRGWLVVPPDEHYRRGSLGAYEKSSRANMSKRIEVLTQAAENMIRMLNDYSSPKTELGADGLVYGYLAGYFEGVRKISRQHHVYMGGSDRNRIDFRLGGNDPIVLEFALRAVNSQGGELYGSTNHSELKKLARFSRTEASLRALLLLDMRREPIEYNALKKTYDGLNAGPGQFERNPVRVIYAHANGSYHFLWCP
jgi:hypothetical protein